MTLVVHETCKNFGRQVSKASAHYLESIGVHKIRRSADRSSHGGSALGKRFHDPTPAPGLIQAKSNQELGEKRLWLEWAVMSWNQVGLSTKRAQL